jgi:hypothetical protein
MAKMSISFAPELGDAVRAAAERGGGEQRLGERLLTEVGELS